MEGPKVGTKVSDPRTEIEVVVVRSPSEPTLEIWPGGSVGLGKRYACQTCDAEVLVTKAGPGVIACHASVMEVAQPKALPSSD
jgi:hypothetical protein